MDKGAELLEGSWVNELGSEIALKPSDGKLKGKYHSATGNATSDPHLTGYYLYVENKDEKPSVLLSFVVMWSKIREGKPFSTTAWTGVYNCEDDLIATTWVRTTNEVKQDKWKNTTINKNVFHRKRIQTNEIHFDIAKLHAKLKTKHLGRWFSYHVVTESTMILSKREVEENAPNGTLILAEEQTRGQARINSRVWVSKPKGNIYMTIIIRNNIDFRSYLLPASALAVVKACTLYGVSAKIKWQNDVWVNSKKLCGMIARNQQFNSKKGMEHFVYELGVGINIDEDMSINEISSIREGAISLNQGRNEKIEREAFLADYLNQLEEILTYDKAKIHQQYLQNCLFAEGAAVLVYPKGVEYAGYIATVVRYDEHFQLVIRDSQNVVKVLNAEEISEGLSVRQ